MVVLDALFPYVSPDHPNPNAKLLPPCLELDKDKRIIIVGGGPAGVHMSAALAAKGYTSVTLLEAEPEVGGKSHTVFDPLQPDVPHELGTCYMHPGYGLVRKLLEEYDPENKESDFATEDKGQMVFRVIMDEESKTKYTKGQEYWDWTLEESEKKTLWSCCRCLPDSFQLAPIFLALKKYLRLHHSYFGTYAYGLPPKPRDWRLINMTATEWMHKNDLAILEPIFLHAQQVQGYGLLDKIPVFYLLWWFHPDLANGSLRAGLDSEELGVSLLKNGWGSLWKKMVERHKEEVTYITSAQVTEIKRTPTVEVKYLKDGETKTVEGDILISAVDMYRFRHLIKDLDAEEEEIFSNLVESVLTTTLYKGCTTKHEHSVEFWFGKIDKVAKNGVGQVYAHRNSRMTARPETPAKDGVELRVSYQYMDRPLEPGDAAKLAETLNENLKDYAEEQCVEIIKQKPWPYFPRFDFNGLQKEYYWKILELQGKRNTIFTGSSVCFESVLDCVAYNRLLLSKICT